MSTKLLIEIPDIVRESKGLGPTYQFHHYCDIRHRENVDIYSVEFYRKWLINSVKEKSMSTDREKDQLKFVWLKYHCWHSMIRNKDYRFSNKITLHSFQPRSTYCLSVTSIGYVYMICHSQHDEYSGKLRMIKVNWCAMFLLFIALNEKSKTCYKNTEWRLHSGEFKTESPLIYNKMRITQVFFTIKHLVAKISRICIESS